MYVLKNPEGYAERQHPSGSVFKVSKVGILFSIYRVCKIKMVF
jgi:hypothetical protein